MVRDSADIAPREFVWDEEIRAHIRRHFVEPEDVEEALQGSPKFFRNLPGRTATHVMLGYDGKGRALYVALSQADAEKWIVITDWESRLARKILEEGS